MTATRIASVSFAVAMALAPMSMVHAEGQAVWKQAKPVTDVSDVASVRSVSVWAPRPQQNETFRPAVAEPVSQGSQLVAVQVPRYNWRPISAQMPAANTPAFAPVERRSAAATAPSQYAPAFTKQYRWRPAEPARTVPVRRQMVAVAPSRAYFIQYEPQWQPQPPVTVRQFDGQTAGVWRPVAQRVQPVSYAQTQRQYAQPVSYAQTQRQYAQPAYAPNYRYGYPMMAYPIPYANSGYYGNYGGMPVPAMMPGGRINPYFAFNPYTAPLHSAAMTRRMVAPIASNWMPNGWEDMMSNFGMHQECTWCSGS